MPSSPGFDPSTPRYRYFSGAECIWKSDLTRAYNCYLAFRRRFHCESPLFAGELRITASDTYRLFINGQCIGEGPVRSERGEAYVDQYSAADLPISVGENIIVVLAQNKHLAEHGQPPKDGALSMFLEGHGANGEVLQVRTGRDWKVRVADWYQKPAPRRFFPIGFNDHFDFRQAPADLLELRHDDSRWDPADRVGDQHLARCRPRPIPQFLRNHIFPRRVLRSGRLASLEGVMGVALDCVDRPATTAARFKTWVYSEETMETSLFFGCDNQAQVSLNGDTIWTQGEKDHAFHHHLSDYEAKYYPGMFHGHGIRMEPNERDLEQSRCTLKAGWNVLEVAIQFLDKAYGFELAFVNKRMSRLPLLNNADQATQQTNTWLWRGEDEADWRPLESQVADMRSRLEPSHLALWEGRELASEPPANVESLSRGGDEDAPPLTLQPGEWIELELETYAVGFLKIVLSGPPGAIVDFMLTERDQPDSDRLPPMHIGMWLVERMTLSGGSDSYTSLERRAGRFLSIRVREAEGPVMVHSIMVRNLRYDHPRTGEFSCSDPVLNWLWDTGATTTALSTFDLMEDCPTREMAQWSGDSYLRTHQLACLWGDMRLSAKALREFADDQAPDRWGRAMVPAGYGDSIVDYALLLPVWAWAHYQITGDRELLKRVFLGVRNLLTHAESLEDARGWLIPENRAANQVYLDMRLVGAVRSLPNVAGLQAYYVRSLEDAALLADLLKQKPLAAEWRTKAESLRQRINDDFWAVDASLYMNGEDADGQLSPETGAETNYIMLWANIPPPDRVELILSQLFPSPDAENLDYWPHGEGVYLKHFMADALLKHGRIQEALTAWRGFYGSMMGQVATMPEAWSRSWANNLPSGQGGTPTGNAPASSSGSLRSLVHPFGAGPIWHLITYLCGLHAAEPGYEKIRWEPMPGDLQSMKARFPLPNRSDYLEFKMEPNAKGGRDLTLSAPISLDVESMDRWLNPADQMFVL